MSRRRLSDDERALWHGAMRSVTPIRQVVRSDTALSGAPADQPAANAKQAPKAAFKPMVAPAVPRPAPPALAPLGRRLRKQVARGTQPIDGRLDLHGLTQAEAHDALTGFLRTAQARGARLVLVITGKGVRGGDGHGERGVLKRQVPMWLRLPELRGLVVGFEPATIGHGGEGALYVRLRNARRPSDD
jgi:DNA-nicking Smr family endonuclease